MHLTDVDKLVLEAVQRSGVVTLDASGQPGLETSGEISVYRVARLVELGVLIANGDGLFDWCPQTYRLADAPPTPQPDATETPRP